MRDEAIGASHDGEPPADRVVQLINSPSGTLLALMASGRIMERVQDARDFATGPRHETKYLWREIGGPPAQKE